MANDPKFVKMYQARFPEPKPEVAGRFGCPYRIDISPDTLNMLLADTTIRDSLRAGGYKNLKETAEKFFEQTEGEGGNTDQDPEKKRGILDRLFGRKQEETPKKDQQ